MHAGWNLFVKRDDDQFLSLTLMAATSGLLCAAALPFMPPITSEAWQVLAISSPLHAGYRLCLSLGYKFGEMSQVYPIARGATPLFVTILSVAFLGLHLEPAKYVGVVVIATGIIGLTLNKGLPRTHEGRAIGFALATAGFIAVFTLFDSRGSRVSGSPITYVLWLFVLEGALMLAIASVYAARRLRNYAATNGRSCMVNGVVMSAAHGLVILALSRSPAALVSALRETSVVFGIVFSAAVLKEKIGAVRLVCTLLVTVGLFVTILG